jgi:hypothetical protein
MHGYRVKYNLKLFHQGLHAVSMSIAPFHVLLVSISEYALTAEMGPGHFGKLGLVLGPDSHLSLPLPV